MNIRLATKADTPALVDLEGRHFVGNLDESERAHGFISIRHVPAWFDAAIDDGGIHVAVGEDAHIAGFIAVTEPSTRTAATASPIVAAVLDLADTVEFHGRPLAQQRYAFRGPVLIDRTARGQGLYGRFNDVTRRAYRDRFDAAVLFVSADNPRSLHTTTTKLGAEVLGSFEADGRPFHFLAFAF